MASFELQAPVRRMTGHQLPAEVVSFGIRFFRTPVHWPPASVEIMKNGAVRTGQLTRRVGLNWRRRSWPNQAHMLPASRLIDELLRLRSTSSSRSVRRRRNIIYKLINCCLLEVIVRATTLVDK